MICKCLCLAVCVDRLVGLVVKASASRAEDPEFDSCLHREFSGVESYQRLKKLAHQWLPCYRVSAGTGWPGVSIPRLVEMESLICNFYLNVAARTVV